MENSNDVSSEVISRSENAPVSDIPENISNSDVSEKCQEISVTKNHEKSSDQSSDMSSNKISEQNIKLINSSDKPLTNLIVEQELQQQIAMSTGGNNSAMVVENSMQDIDISINNLFPVSAQTIVCIFRKAIHSGQDTILYWYHFARKYDRRIDEVSVSNKKTLEEDIITEDGKQSLETEVGIPIESHIFPKNYPEIKDLTKISVLPEKVSSETEVRILPINKNASPNSHLSISILPGDQEERRNLVIYTTLEQFNNLSFKHSNEHSDHYDYLGICPACNGEHKGDGVKGWWGDGNYYSEKTYCLYCYERTFSRIPIVNVKV
ncbi:44360_t:CDS:2 [Gigaspora margarita]|uniref:44360_t:CDS:1 n=1 Tax=Gigaspora margarita TaxID=4874 RepID=A0ABN7VMS6_GIGMA|nr:44360_t:CDS:2 [Gigaspora margarita]